MLSKIVTRPLKLVLLELGPLTVLLAGAFLWSELAIHIEPRFGEAGFWVFLGVFIAGFVLTGTASVVLLGKTDAWKFAYDVEGWSIEREERRLHPKRTKFIRAARRILIWFPSAVAAFVLFFFPAATHVLFPTAGHLSHYRVPLPWTWTILPRMLCYPPEDLNVLLSSGKVAQFAFWKGHPLNAEAGFQERQLGGLAYTFDSKFVSEVLRRDFRFGNGSLTCWQYRRDLDSHWRVLCGTPEEGRDHPFSAWFRGREEDLPDFYDVVSQVKSLD